MPTLTVRVSQPVPFDELLKTIKNKRIPQTHSAVLGRKVEKEAPTFGDLWNYLENRKNAAGVLWEAHTVWRLEITWKGHYYVRSAKTLRDSHLMGVIIEATYGK